MMQKVIMILLVLSCALSCAIWAADTPIAPSSPTPLPKTKINPKDGAEMVWIPAGKFLMGSKDDVDSGDEHPQHTVNLDGYYIYKYDVTVAQYRKFCADKNRQMPAAPAWGWIDTHPVVNVTWDDAIAYATWANAALPTEAQWEKAARGKDGRAYPWGNDWDAAKCQCSKKEFGDAKQTAPVGAFPAGSSPYGCQDMAGNVWQWCADWYDENYYKAAPINNPAGPTTGTMRVLRGDSWYFLNPVYFRAAVRSRNSPTFWPDSFGFRCVCVGPGQ